MNYADDEHLPEVAVEPAADAPTPKADKDRFVSSPHATTGVSEVSIAVNPSDRNQVICASNKNGTNQALAQYYCADGGGFWHTTGLPKQSGDLGHQDPSVAWTSDGVAWATTIASIGTRPFAQLRVYRSTDQGKTWIFDATPPQSELGWEDRATLCSDTLSGNRKDYLYVTYTHGTAHHDVYVSWRENPSATTAWKTATASLSGSETTGAATGGDIAVNGAGDVFVFWPDTESGKLFVAKSQPGWSSGSSTTLSFGSPVKIATTYATDAISIPAASQRPPSIYISGAAYKSLDRDMVYAVWMDLNGRSGCTLNSNAPGSNVNSTCQTRIWFSKSKDGGTTWSAAQKINHWVPYYDEFHPRIAVDDTNGHLALSFYASDSDANRTLANVFCLFSADEGASWSNRVCVTSLPSDEASPTDESQYGDYAGLSGRAGVFLPAWTDRRHGKSGQSQIWTAPVHDPYEWSNLSRPAAAVTCKQGVGAFIFGEYEAQYACVLGSDNQIWVCSFDGVPPQWHWQSLSTPAGTTVTGVVGAVGTQSSDVTPPDRAFIFFTCADGNLYRYEFDGGSWTLSSCGKPSTTTISAGVPFGALAIFSGGSTDQTVYALVQGADGQAWAIHLNLADSSWKWEACGTTVEIGYVVRGLTFVTMINGQQYPGFYYSGPKPKGKAANLVLCWYDGAAWQHVTMQDGGIPLQIHDLLAASATVVATGASFPAGYYTTYPDHYPAVCLYDGGNTLTGIISTNPITYGLGAMELYNYEGTLLATFVYYWDTSGELRRQKLLSGTWTETFYGTPSASIQVVGNVGIVDTGKSIVQRPGIYSFVIGSDGNLWRHRSTWST